MTGQTIAQEEAPGSGLAHRWFQVGVSDVKDSYEAGTSAAASALGNRTDTKLLVVFSAEGHDLDQLLAGINDRSGGVPLIGCSTAGEIAAHGPDDASVVVTALGGAGFTVSTGVAKQIEGNLREAGAAAASCMPDDPGSPHRVLMLLTDGLSGDQQEIVRGAYSVVGAGVPLVGGCAGDDLKMKSTYQFYGREVLTDAVVAAAIESDAPFGIGVCHGWRTVGTPMLTTKSSNNRVYEIDDEPALDVYLRAWNPPADAHHDAAAFTQFALTHPLGLESPSGEHQVRFIGDANFEDRSLGCIAEVPQGSLVWLMEGDSHSVLAATDTACRLAFDGLGGAAPIGAIAFDCIARKGILGDAGVKEEVDRIANNAAAPVAGFYTYGEIARTKGLMGFHNQTLVVLAVS